MSQPLDSSSELDVARISAVDRDRYLIRYDHLELHAELTGRLRFTIESAEELPCVGDFVRVQFYDDNTQALIHDVLTRKSLLRRKTPGKRVEYQSIAANIDVAFVVQSCDADFNLRRLERYLVMIADAGVEPALLLSKTDLISASALDVRIQSVRESGFEGRIVPLSSVTEAGVQEFQELLEPGKAYCLLGSSGVGKTTLTNLLIGEETFDTAPIREKDNRGRHTTTRRHMILLDKGAFLIDNPGMRELGFVEVDEGFDEVFSEITALITHCKFRDCTHTQETGCAVLEAVESGDVRQERYDGFMKLTREAAYNERSYVERRRRDKELGKFYKSVLKGKKDRR